MIQEPSPNKRQLRQAYYRMRKRCQVDETKGVTKKKRKSKLLKLQQKEAYADHVVRQFVLLKSLFILMLFVASSSYRNIDPNLIAKIEHITIEWLQSQTSVYLR